MKLTFLSIIPLIFFSCNTAKKDGAIFYQAGFKTIHAVDTSRMYKPATVTTDYLHYRPLDIDIWYPANVSVTDSVLLLRNILGLFDKRASYYTASNAGYGLSQQVAHRK